MKKFEEMTFNEKILRSIIIDLRKDLIGGMEITTMTHMNILKITQKKMQLMIFIIK